MVSKDNLRDGRVRNWFYLENDLLDREDLTIYEKTVYIVIARYVNSDNKAFPSYETIARKGSMAKVQAIRVVKSLTQKGLLKKEVRKNNRNGGSTSNLYTLLNPKLNNKTEGVSDRYPGSVPQIPGVVSDRDPNNTSIKKINLNNVNRTSREAPVENFGEEVKGEKSENIEDIKDIRKKIRKSLEENNKESILEVNNLEKYSNPENNYSGNGKTGKYFPNKERSAEKEQLAKQIAEEMGDDHSLGAFRTIVDKIPQQQIRIFFSIIKDTHLTGKIKRNKGAMFISLAKAYAKKNNVNLNFK